MTDELERLREQNRTMRMWVDKHGAMILAEMDLRAEIKAQRDEAIALLKGVLMVHAAHHNHPKHAEARAFLDSVEQRK